jgi:hypothetical protein
MAQLYAAQLLANSLKRTYKGELVFIAKPKLKPYDRIFIWDSYADMAGPVEVEEVVHSFSMETGFTSEIVPNAMISVADVAKQTMGDALIGFGAGLLTSMGAIFAATQIPGIISGFVNADVLGIGPATAQALSGTSAAATAPGLLATVAPLPIFGGAVLALAGWGAYKFLRYMNKREPLLITPLIKQGKPFFTGVEGMEVDGLLITDILTSETARDTVLWKKWSLITDDFGRGWDLYKTAARKARENL